MINRLEKENEEKYIQARKIQTAQPAGMKANRRQWNDQPNEWGLVGQLPSGKVLYNEFKRKENEYQQSKQLSLQINEKRIANELERFKQSNEIKSNEFVTEPSIQSPNISPLAFSYHSDPLEDAKIKGYLKKIDEIVYHDLERALHPKKLKNTFNNRSPQQLQQNSMYSTSSSYSRASSPTTRVTLFQPPAESFPPQQINNLKHPHPTSNYGIRLPKLQPSFPRKVGGPKPKKHAVAIR